MDIKTINDYRVFEQIGEGVNGIVYKAWDNKHNRQVALKIFKPDGVKALTKQIWLNTRSLIDTNHPNFACIYEMEEYEGITYIASEFLDGKSLKDLILHRESEDVEPFVLIEQVVSALGELHKLNLIHGNLKPTNLKIAEDGHVVLLDPFLSQFSNYQNRPDYVIPYEAYHYIAPEQIEGKELSVKTDFFACGVIMYQMITGELPFTGIKEANLNEAILYHEPDYSKLKSKSINSIRLLLIEKLLAKNPTDRFTDINELMITLREISYFDQTVEKLNIQHEEKKSPRPYLLVSILIALFFIFWFIISSNNY